MLSRSASFRRYGLFFVALVLVPALAIAAPKKKKPKAKAKKAEPTKVEEPAEPAPTPEPTPTTPGTTPVPPNANLAPSNPNGGQGGAGAGSGGGGGAANPADKPAEAPSDEPVAADPDVDALRQEYLQLRDELFKSRARANTVASQLYSTRVQIRLTYTTARYYNPAKASIRLDGASVYEDATGAIAGDDGIRFDGYVAPGRHLITFRVEATGKDDDSFTSVTESQIVVKAVAGKDLVVAAKAKDGGDISYAWKKGENGSYGLGIDVAVKTVARAADAGGVKGGKK
ncbi:MAG: hypothetical protein ACKV2T_30070 [Kofleriaceae bacterium]